MNDLDFFVDEFAAEMKERLREAKIKWGDTWRHRPIYANSEYADQDTRLLNDIQRYTDQYKHAGIPLPLVDMAIQPFINWVRLNHPEELKLD